MILLAFLTVLGLAVGRITFCITRDEIFRPLREWVWLRSAPDSASILIRDPEKGDLEQPARMWHQVTITRVFVDEFSDGHQEVIPVRGKYEFTPGNDLRKPGFFGQLIECPFCLSFWIALPFAALYLYDPALALNIATPFAVWAIGTIVAVKGL